MKLSIIIPCYNEAATVEAVVTRVQDVSLPTGWDREILVVDDGSGSDTREALQRITLASSAVRVITRPINGGKGRAVKDGLSETTGDYIIIQDADLEYDPNDYSRLLAPIIAGETEVVFGSRNLSDNNSPGRAMYFWGGQLVTWCFNIAFGTRLSDITTCYKMFPRKLVPELLAQPSDDFVFDAIELSRVLTRGKVIEIPIRYAARTEKQGKKLRAIHGVWCIERLVELRLGAKLYRVLKFIFVGGFAAAVNLAVLFLCTSILGIWYLVSSVISFLVALFTNFLLQKFWAFKNQTKFQVRQLAAFVGTNVVNLGFNTLLMYLFVSHFGIHYLYAQLLTSLLIAFESFFIYRLIFGSKN